MARPAVLPPNLAPRGINRAEAAAYVGISPVKFDQMIADGRMPRAKCIDRRRVWDVRPLDECFDRLPVDGQTEANENDNPWDH